LFFVSLKPLLTSFLILQLPSPMMFYLVGSSLSAKSTPLSKVILLPFLVSLLVCSWVSCFCGIFRSFSRGLEEGGLLEASPCAAGAPEPGECTSSQFCGDSFVCFVAALVLLSEEVLFFRVTIWPWPWKSV
jgi:hypothetical protein